MGRFLLRPFCAQPMAHAKKEPDVEVGLHTVDAGLFLENLKKEQRSGSSMKKEEWEVDDPPPSPTATALDMAHVKKEPDAEVEVGLRTLDAAVFLAQRAVDAPKAPKTEGEEIELKRDEEVAAWYLAQMARKLEPVDEEVMDPRLKEELMVDERKKVKEEEVEPLVEVKEETMIDEQKKEKEKKKDKKEELIGPDEAAPVRSMHQTRPTAAKSSSYKIDASKSRPYNTDARAPVQTGSIR